jgi:hypothetical protein
MGSFNGDYSAGLTLSANTIANIAVINLRTGSGAAKLTLNDGNCAAGHTLLVNGGNLTSSHTAYVNGAAGTDGTQTTGRRGKAHADRRRRRDAQGNGGADKLTGAPARTTPIRRIGPTGLAHDSITHFDAASDTFNLFTVTGTTRPRQRHALREFQQPSAAASTPERTSRRLFTPTAGDEAEQTFRSTPTEQPASGQCGPGDRCVPYDARQLWRGGLHTESRLTGAAGEPIVDVREKRAGNVTT